MTNLIKCFYAKCFIYLFLLSCISSLYSAGEKNSIDPVELKEYKNETDESDDSTRPYYNITGARIRKTRAANTFCIAPVSTPDKTVSYSCPGEDSSPCLSKGLLRQFTIATIQCIPDYFPVPETNFQSICNGRNWSPPIDRCYKICEKLSPVNVDLQCFRKGINIACDENLLLAGTRVRPTCKPLYKYRDFVPTYQEIVCKEDGRWDRELFSCVPECGRTFANAETLIAGGIEERYGDSPWHVAIYDEDKILICGGTIISEHLVLSAAHCFYDPSKNIKLNATNYEVVVSKVSRNYSEIDNKYQKVFKIDEIRYSDKGFRGLDSFYAADIVILILHEKITLSPLFCLLAFEWIPVPKPPEGIGMGTKRTWKIISALKTADLPFISRARCLDTVPNDFKRFITLDKFCAGSEKGASTLQGDSGGGLLFREGNFYYIRGIVSLKQPTSTAISAFTDIADHIEWIMSVRNAIEEQNTRDGVLLPSKKIPLECGIQIGNLNESTPWHVSIYNVTENRVTCGGTLISPRLILSAAHCFKSSDDLNQYEVAVNKLPRSQKAFKIKELRFLTTDRTAANYDIVILILSQKLTFYSQVSPACVEWKRTTEFRAPEGTIGKFIGWDWNRNGTTVLVPQSLPFMSHDHCADKLYSNTFRSFVQFDKFCADLKIPYFAPSRGSGFIFQQDGRNYIRGIMSMRLPTQVGIALFTDISYYTNLIIAVLDEIE